MKTKHKFLFMVLALECLLQGVIGLSRSDLYKHVQEKSEPLVPPMDGDKDALDISFHMSLFSINRVDDKAQVLSFTMGIGVIWNNKHVTWNASHYSDVAIISLPAKLVWFPRSVCVQNEVGVNKCFPEDSTALISADGTTSLIEVLEISISCKMGLKYFPFDKQTCVALYTNRIPHVEKLRFKLRKLNKEEMSYFAEHTEWTLTDASAEVKDVLSNVPEDNNLIINIKLQRKPFFAICSNLLPIWILSVLNIVCFLVPVKSGEKMNTCIIIFLSFAVFLTGMKDSMPQTSDEVSYFLVYVFTQLIVSGLVVVLEAIVLHVHHQHEDSELIGSELSMKLEKYFSTNKDMKLKRKPRRISSRTLDKIFGISVILINLTSLIIYLVFSLTEF
ncbi:neuronal acetylcholine receptor subunit alpha-3-like [Saccostrea cucullata]|uniref:neuronal acetylcholine receptor subunit alpha-3-like n=1 Tax=Saccostrea cuccullata TaxID=36930 RepID=UPI002ED1BE51